MDGSAAKQFMSLPSFLWEYASFWIFVYFRSINSIPLQSIAQMACASPNSLPSQMLSVPMASPRGCGGRVCGGRDVLYRQSAPWRIGWEKVNGILVSPGKKVRKRRKIPVLATVESTSIFFVAPFLSTERSWSQGATFFVVTGRLVWGRHPLDCIWPRFHL